MDIRKLSYFVEVVNEHSFSHAAQSCFFPSPCSVKQSTARKRAGSSAYQAEQQSVQITEAGKLIYQQSIKILNDCKELEHLLDESKGMISGSVSISMPAIVMSVYFVPIFIDIQNKYPELHIDLFEEGSHTVLESIVSDAVDIGVVMLPVPTQEIDVHTIVSDQCVLMVSRSIRYRRKKSVDISRLEREKFILFNRNFVLYDMIRQACYSRQFSPNVTFQSSRTSFIFNMVSRNQGITILPAPTFPSGQDDLCQIKLTPEIPWTLALIIKKNRYLSPAVLKVIEYITDHFRSNNHKITL